MAQHLRHDTVIPNAAGCCCGQPYGRPSCCPRRNQARSVAVKPPLPAAAAPMFLSDDEHICCAGACPRVHAALNTSRERRFESIQLLGSVEDARMAPYCATTASRSGAWREVKGDLPSKNDSVRDLPVTPPHSEVAAQDLHPTGPPGPR